jgi:hypothetical protein
VGLFQLHQPLHDFQQISHLLVDSYNIPLQQFSDNLGTYFENFQLILSSYDQYTESEGPFVYR